MSYFHNPMQAFDPNTMVVLSQLGGVSSYYQGLNPYMGQVGQANGQMMADQANMMSKQIQAATRQQEEMEPVLELQRKRSKADLINDKDLRKLALNQLDREIMAQLGTPMPDASEPT